MGVLSAIYELGTSLGSRTADREDRTAQMPGEIRREAILAPIGPTDIAPWMGPKHGGGPAARPGRTSEW